MKILSSNIWGLPWPLSKDKKGRFQKFVKVIESEIPQIICLQEVWLKKDIEFLKDKFANNGYKNFAEGGLVMNRGGLVTFSKFPIQKAEFIPFKKKQNFLKSLKAKLLREESFWTKGFSVTLVEIEGKTFAIINVHMSYFSRKCDKERVSKIKAAEIEQLFNHIKTIKKNTSGIFMGGDFNIDVKDIPSIPKGLKIISDTSTHTLEKTNPYAKADNYHGPDVVCDLIFGPDSADITDKRTIKSSLISDHYMVISEVEI